MKKLLNKDVYDRLILQASEAEELGMIKLAEHVRSILPPEEYIRDNEKNIVTDSELRDKVDNSLWQIVAHFADAYNVKNIDVLKIAKALDYVTKNLYEEIHDSLDLDSELSLDDDRIPGKI